MTAPLRWRLNKELVIAVDDARVEVMGTIEEKGNSAIAVLPSTTHTHYGCHTHGLVHRSLPITG